MLFTTFLDIVIEKFQKLTKRETSLLLLCIFILVSFNNGISLVPHDDYQRLSQNPFTTRTDINAENYWQESVLLPVIAFVFKLNTPLSYFFLCFFVSVAGYLLFTHLTLKLYNSVATLIFTVILITNPITTVLFSWVGTVDSLTFALTIPFLFIDSVFLIFVLALLGITNHVIFIIAIGEILILRWISKDKIKTHHFIAALFGGIFGYELVRFFLTFNHIQLMTSRLDFIFSRGLYFWIGLNFANFPASVISLFNTHWLIILVCIVMFFKIDKVYYSSLLIILLFNYGITFFTEDTTRVFSLLSWGILLGCIFHSYKLALNNDSKATPYLKQYLLALIIIGFISFISLRFYSWGGTIHNATPIYRFIQQFINF